MNMNMTTVCDSESLAALWAEEAVVAQMWAHRNEQAEQIALLRQLLQDVKEGERMMLAVVAQSQARLDSTQAAYDTILKAPSALGEDVSYLRCRVSLHQMNLTIHTREAREMGESALKMAETLKALEAKAALEMEEIRAEIVKREAAKEEDDIDDYERCHERMRL